MNKAHALINWENYPSINTPLNAANLNKLDSSVDVIDNRVVELDANKATKVEVNSLVADVSYDENTGIFTVTKKNGSKITIDTKLEKLAINFTYEPTTQQLVITLDDGTKQYIDLSALITQYEFMDTDTVSFLIDTNGKVSAIVKEGSIEEKHLEPNYLAKIKVEVAKGQSSAEAAALSEANAKASEKAAKVSETNSKASEEASLAYAQSAESCATAAQTAKEDAETAKTAAEDAMQSAQTSASEAEQSKKSAAQSASDAAASRDSASDSRDGALTAQINASASAESAQKYATGVTDSAKYYYEQAKAISESFSGALRPMGTLKFSELPDISIVTAGDMYNVSDEFVTTSDFKEGAGNTQSAGTNVYKTIDGKWDCLAGAPVTGIKGANESTFRRGNVNITPDNIGAVATNGDASNTTVAFTQASARENIETGETKSTLFGKIKKWFTDLKAVAFTGSYNDLSNRPSIPSVGNGTITINQGGATKGSFSMNQSGDATVNLTDSNTWRPVQNNLTSDSTTDCLAAAQGKILKGLIDELNNNLPSISVSRSLTSGTKIGTITLNGTAYDLYCQTNSDTKNTTGTTNKTATKLFLAGATSQAVNPQTYSNSNVYVGTDNELYSNGKKVAHQEDVDKKAAKSWTQIAYSNTSGTVTLSDNHKFSEFNEFIITYGYSTQIQATMSIPYAIMQLRTENTIYDAKNSQYALFKMLSDTTFNLNNSNSDWYIRFYGR